MRIQIDPREKHPKAGVAVVPADRPQRRVSALALALDLLNRFGRETHTAEADICQLGRNRDLDPGEGQSTVYAKIAEKESPDLAFVGVSLGMLYHNHEGRLRDKNQRPARQEAAYLPLASQGWVAEGQGALCRENGVSREALDSTLVILISFAAFG